MDILEAKSIIEDFYDKSNYSDEDEFIFIEAMEYIIETEKDPHAMMELGGHYYDKRRFDLALKYYEMASAYDIDEADECLGYIWYYGRTGEKDYKKAFNHYLKSMKRGNLVSSYKIADMYKNGYFVEKNYDKYVSIIKDLYPKVEHARHLGEPLPEIFTRLANIRKGEGDIREALRLYRIAKDFLAQRISYNAFFGNLNIMKWLIDDLYEITDFDKEDFDFYDMYYLLKNPVKIGFTYRRKKYEIESLTEEGTCVIKFNDKWFRDRDEFYARAVIDGEKMTAVYDRLKNFEVI